MKNRIFLLSAALLAALCFALAVGCGDDDDDQTVTPSSDDDDDTGDDDDTAFDAGDDDLEKDCEAAVDAIFGDCGFLLWDMNGDFLDHSGMLEFCWLSENILIPGAISPFWNCLFECALYDCNENCWESCFNPDGSGGCTDTVNDIYACKILWLYPGKPDSWIPEMDMAATCNEGYWPWDCYQNCFDNNNDCPDDSQAAMDCMDICDEEWF